MSIIRVGLAETKKFAEGWEAIFGKKEETNANQAEEARADSSDKEVKKEEPKQS